MNQNNSNQSYTEKTAKNSAWATLAFIVASLGNFVISIELTHYFGKTVYGQYSYFIWLSSILTILAGLGLNQTITKFISRYFFGTSEEKIKAKILLRKILLFQFIAAIIANIIIMILANPFQKLLNFDANIAQNFIFVAGLSIIPLTLNTLFTSAFAAIQEFKKLSLIQSIISILNLLLISLFIIIHQDLIAFLWGFFALNIGSTALLIIGFSKFFKKIPKQKSPTLHTPKEIWSYAAWNYLSNIFGQIAWDRSEIFFLGFLQDSSQIATYTIAYGLAVLLINAFGPISTVLTNITAEIVGSEKTELVGVIAQHASKYVAIIIFPALILGSFLMPELVNLVYGKSFLDVATIFPWLVVSHAIGIVVNPASNIAYFKNEVRKMTILTIATGSLNLILDAILIPRLQIYGAVIANTVAQFFSITMVLINAKKYRLGLFNNYMLKVITINILLAIGLFIINIFTLNLFLKTGVTLIAMITYLWLIIKLAFNSKDLELLKNLNRIIPKSLQKIWLGLLKKIEKSTQPKSKSSSML